MITNSCKPCTAGTFNMCIVCIEKAFVMKIIFLFKIVAGVLFAVNLSYVQVKKCPEINLSLVRLSNRTPTLSSK